MSQPTKFSITVSFASDEANGVSGRSTVKTASLDGLMAGIKSTTDQIIANLALIQRDDGEILDGQVKIHTLSSDVLALLSSTAFHVRGGWITGTAYAVGDIVIQAGVVYLCMVAHTSGTFATDLAAAKWGAITVTVTATGVSFAATSTISASNVQAAIVELDQDLRPMQTLLLRELFNGL